MNLNKEDYENIVRLLEEVPVKGIKSIKYVAVLLHKLEQRVALWFDGHPTGYQVQDIPKDLPSKSQDVPAPPSQPASLPPALLAALPALLSQTEIPLNKE